MTRQACRHCKGGSVDLVMHEQNCVSNPDNQGPKPSRLGDPCPMKGCGVPLEQEDDYLLCNECGYCPEEEFDHRIDDCPLCKAFCYVTNQGNIRCSGCTLQLTAKDEETALALWNKLPRNKESK